VAVSSPDSSVVYIINQGDDNISVIQTLTNTIIDTIPVGLLPQMVVFHPDGSSAYVRNFFGNSISVIRTADRTVVDTIQVGIGPIGIDITADGLFLYTTDSDSGTVTVINTSQNRVINTIGVGGSPSSFGTFITSEACFVSAIPTLGQWGLISLVIAIGIAGFITIRRKSTS